MTGTDERESGRGARLLLARASARLAVGHAYERYWQEMLAAFRKEIAGTVDVMSPVLPVLLATGTAPLEEVAWALRPVEGWPELPNLPMAGAHPAARPQVPEEDGDPGPLRWPRLSSCHGMVVLLPTGDRLWVHVVDQSLEVSGSLGGYGVRTLFGVLRITLPAEADETALNRCVGRPLDRIVRHPAMAGRGWEVKGIHRLVRSGEMRLEAWTGVEPMRLPWS